MQHRARALRWMTAALLVVAAGAILSGRAEASAPAPDASCSQEHGLRSLNDNTPATILFVNHSSVVVQTFWLDFTGKRVFYARIPVAASYTQRTWITHPWIVADLSATCLTLHITGTRADTVVVSDAPVAATPATTTASSPVASPATTSGTAVGPVAANNSGSGTAKPGSGFPTPLLIAGLAAAAVLAAAAAWWANLKSKPSLLEPGGPPPDAWPAGSPPGYDLSPTKSSTSPAGYDLSPTKPSTSPAGYDASPTQPSTSPAGYDAAPTPPSTAPAGYDAAPTPPSTTPPGYEPPPTGGD
jgi:hypothetical protein